MDERQAPITESKVGRQKLEGSAGEVPMDVATRAIVNAGRVPPAQDTRRGEFSGISMKRVVKQSAFLHFQKSGGEKIL